jgi:hypothetical protein
LHQTLRRGWQFVKLLYVTRHSDPSSAVNFDKGIEIVLVYPAQNQQP